MRFRPWGTIALVLLPGTMPFADVAALPAPLAARLRQIEVAFRDGRGQALGPSLSAAARIRVDLAELTSDGGSYGRGQLQVIFDRIFAEFRTKAFSFEDGDVIVPSPGTAFARVRWIRVRRSDGSEATDTLTFTLREQEGDWRVLEVRSSR